MTDSAGMEKEKLMKQLKRTMECWREVILPLNSILLWERSWHPGLIFGITSTAFLMIWMMEPALLTMISLSLLVLALVDYFVPTLTSIFCSGDSWTGQKEKKLNEICQSLSDTILQFQSMWGSMIQMRHDRPNIYYGIITICLIFCAWIGSTINNLFLFYIAVNAILLAPGLRHKGCITSGKKFVFDYLSRAKVS